MLRLAKKRKMHKGLKLKIWYHDFTPILISELSSGAYERFCTLFNIGALLSQLGSTQNQTNDDGLKTAAKYFQRAAGIFTFLKDNVYPVLQTLPTPDLSVSCLTALNSIMLAQAQDCFYMKATAGKNLSKAFYRSQMFKIIDGSYLGCFKKKCTSLDYFYKVLKKLKILRMKSVWKREGKLF